MVRKSNFRRIIPIAVMFMLCFSLSLITHPLTIGHSSLAYTQDVANSNIYYLPHLNLGQGWQTTINITNTACNGKHRRVNVTLTAYDKEGVSLGVITGVKRLRANKTKMINTQTLPPGTESLKIESNGNLICNAIFKTTDGKKSEVVPAIKEPSKQLDFPALVSYDDLYIYKTITLLNPNTTPASVDIIALDKEGYEIDRNALPSLSLMESRTFPLIEIFGPRILKDLSTVRVNSDSNIIGLQLVDYPGVDLVGLPALASTSKGWTFPIATKGENFDLWTKVGILNPGNDIANFTVEAFDASSNSLGIIQSQTILPGVTYVINTINLDTIEGDAIPSNTAILKVTSTQPVIGYEVIGILDGNGLAAAMGIPDEDTIVGGFEITGSMDGGVLNTYSMMRMGDGRVEYTMSGLDSGLFEIIVGLYVIEPEITQPSTRREETKSIGVVQSPPTPFLAFPLPDRNAFTADISSVFDHSMKNRYCPDPGTEGDATKSTVVAYTNEKGIKVNKFEPVPSSKNCPGCNDKPCLLLYSFMMEGEAPPPFYINGHYLGTNKQPYALNYDGHPGYDYPVKKGTTVRAAASGKATVVPGSDVNLIYIDHPNGYRTLYMHLDTRDETINGKQVQLGQVIGTSGDIGAKNAFHLHFEVRNAAGIPVDPYGWDKSKGEDDPYTKYNPGVVNYPLWLQPNSLPNITSINPTSGVAGTPVSIYGTNFGTTQGTVKFGTAVATVTSWSDTKIIATAPTGSGTVNVTVTTTGGTSNGAQFTYTTTTICIDTVSSDHWKGEYYNNKGLSGSPSLVRNDGNGFIDFDWGSGSPNSFGACLIGNDNFSVRWTRTVSFDASTYRFKVTCDDGFRLYIDGSSKLEKWIDQGSTEYTVDVPLSAGNHTIIMEYYEAGGGAVAKLSWQAVSSTYPPPPITDLRATAECDGTRSQIRLNWTASSGATSYDIYRNYSLYFSNVTETQFINYGNITVGETYTYSVRAKNAYGSSVDSNIVSATAKDCSGSITQVERVTNGSFSSGTSGWTLSGDFWAGTNLPNSKTEPGYAAGGVDSGGTAKNNAHGYMYQAVAIPSNATSATVSFWYNITSNETGYGSYDVLDVTVQNFSGNYLATIAKLDNTYKGSLKVYSKKTLDVTSYKGQTIRIYFLATTDPNNTTVFRIDDVSLMSDGN